MNYEHFTPSFQLMLLQNLPDTAVFVFDSNLRYQLAEGPEIYQWPYQSEQLVGKTLADVFPAEHYRVFAPLYRHALAGEEMVKECQLYDMTYRVTLFNLPQADTAARFGAAIFQNITMYDQLVTVLHNQEYRYHSLFEQTNDAVFILDIEGRHVGANQRAVQMFGYSLNEIVGMKYENMVAKDEFAQSTLILQGLLAGEVYPVYERTFIKKDGNPLVAEVNIALVRSYEGEPMYIQSVIRDITRRKLTEMLLRENEQRYRILTEMISDFAYAYTIHEDGNSTLEWVTDDSFQRITGYMPQEMGSRGAFSIWHPEDVPEIKAQRARVIAGESIMDEHRLVTKSGEIRWMQVYRRPVWDDQKQRVVRMYGIAQDITDRKLAEAALRASEERYRSLTELISDYAFSICVHPDQSMEIEWVTNESFLRLTGYGESETQRFSTTVLYHPDDKYRVEDDLQLVAHGKAVTGEYRIITKTGAERWLQIHRRPVWDEQQQRVVRFYGIAQDVTEQKLAEDALRRSEELLNQTQQIARVGGWELDVRLNQLIWTKQTREIHEVPDDFVPTVGEAIAFYHPDGIPVISQAVEGALRGTPYDLELRVITAKGNLIWVRAIGHVEYEKQQVIRIYGIFQDITERKEAETRLRESEERYRNITELISDYAFSIRVADDTGDFIFEWMTEDSLLRITGYTLEEFHARSIAHPDDQSRLVREMEAVKLGQTNNSVFRIITKWGDTRWLRLDRYPVWDTDYTRVTGYYGIAHDITEMKQAEDALRESEERFRLISQSTLDGLYDIDLMEQQAWLSDGYRRLFKLTNPPPNILDWWISRIHPDDKPEVQAQFNRLLNSNSSRWSAEYRIYDMQDRLIFINDRGHIIPDESGKAERLIGAVTDVTQQREIEHRKLEVMVEREKLQIFTDFITAISHDFRNPLSILNTSIYLLEKTNNPHDQQRHLTKLKREAAHIEVLVDGLLTMAQLDSPEEFHFSPLNINELLHYVEVREQNLFDECQLTLTLQPGSDLPLVQADLNWLYRALRNLVSNARLYTPEGGEVTVSTYHEHDKMVVAVRDNGIGISAEHLPRIFDPLYRVESHRPSSGQGLGLSIARKIVARHEGFITASSTPDQGSIFRIFLPVAGAETLGRLD